MRIGDFMNVILFNKNKGESPDIFLKISIDQDTLDKLIELSKNPIECNITDYPDAIVIQIRYTEEDESND
jgi:NADPH-dependent 7-cyano-7-deazaguanine reductase QueF